MPWKKVGYGLFSCGFVQLDGLQLRAFPQAAYFCGVSGGRDGVAPSGVPTAQKDPHFVLAIGRVDHADRVTQLQTRPASVPANAVDLTERDQL